MYKHFILLLTVFFSLTFCACTKQVNSPTNGELVASELQKVIKPGESVFIFDFSTNRSIDSGTLISISNDGFMTISNGNTVYNLEHLKSYYNSVTSTGNNWFLYF